MPTIQSRKYPDNERFLTVEEWKIAQEKDIARRFKIVDDGDMQDTVIATPMNFTDYSKPPENTDRTFRGENGANMNREDLKKWLDENGIEYNVRTSTPKLYQLYLDNQL